ncbi:MAG TPA: hypothetical protein VGI40_28450 [Pirellulaceae bacterium]
MSDEPLHLPPDRKVEGDSRIAKTRFYVSDAIRFIAANTDRELANKIAAVVVAFCYLIAIAIHQRAVTPMVPLAVVLLVPLGLIWFPEELGCFTGYVSRGGYINNETPPTLVAFMGWLFLVLIGIPIVAISLGYQ